MLCAIDKAGILRQPPKNQTFVIEAENQLLSRRGPGTPMGDLIRQYWIPVLQSAEYRPAVQ